MKWRYDEITLELSDQLMTCLVDKMIVSESTSWRKQQHEMTS